MQTATYRPLPFEGHYLWYNAGHPLTDAGDYHDHLPAEVFARLDDYLPRSPRVTEMVRAYPTEAAAVAALQRAMV